MSDASTTAAGAAEPGELLDLNERSRVSRIRTADGKSFILKEIVGRNAERRLRHETRILERLSAVEGVPRLAGLPAPPGAILTCDPDATPLPEVIEGRAMAVPALAGFAAGLAAILAAVHREGVAHKNITPQNVIVTRDGAPFLINFSLATTFAEERPGFVHHREIAGELPYLAPEQTGRTGRSTDQRADLYAFGATLYRLATGTPPFEEKDPLQLIHDILALVPVPPAWRNPAVPQPLNDIIMRLLEKEPDRRYQSAAGLAHDLRLLRDALAEGKSGPLRLGERDFAPRLSSPSRLVGREREVEVLREALQRAVAGKGACVLVSGRPGVGKSRLLNELRPMLTARRGFFGVGKFDRHRRDLESDAVYQSLRAVGRLLLAEPDRELAVLRQRILDSLGPNAGLVGSLVPEFALLMGEPAPAPADALPGNKARLVQATLDLLRAVASPERPLVLALDDLQWSPHPPVGLVEALANEAIPGVLLVGAYREGELDPLHPLSAVLPLFSGGGRNVLLRLGNLDGGDLALFLKEILRLEPEQARELAAVVAGRSGGNPYDSVELVNALRREGALAPSHSGWSWDEGAIRRYVGSGDVVELLEARIARLTPVAQELLELMSCLGGEVDAELLAVAAGVTPDELEERLTPCVQDGLLVRTAGVRFRHDRVQHAAFGRIGARRPLMHLSLARRLAGVEGVETLAAEQYLPALELLEPEERMDALRLLRRAAAGVRRVNVEEEERFLRGALTIAEACGMPGGRALLGALKCELHGALYALGRLEEADATYAGIEELCPDPLERAGAGCNQVCSLTNRARGADAMELGLRLLRELGLSLPAAEELEATTLKGLDHFVSWIRRVPVEEDARRPELTHPAAQAAARLISRIIPPAFFCGRPMIAWWLVIESQRLWAEHGPCAALVGPLAHLGFVSIVLGKGYRDGRDAVRHVLAVSAARGWEPETAHIRFLDALTIGPWFDPLQENVRRALRSEEVLLQGGNLQDAAFTFYVTCCQQLDCAPSLEEYAAVVERGLAFAARTGNAQIEGVLLPHRELVSLLTAPHADAARAPFLDDAALRSPAVAGISHLAGALWGALSGADDVLNRHAGRLPQYLPYLNGTHLLAQASLIQALSLARCAAAAGEEREELLARLDAEQAFLAERAVDMAENFLHLVHWVDAERAWAAGDGEKALSSFDAALTLAFSVERPWQRALICERAALLHLERGLEHLGHMLLAQAREAYRAWGATAKVRQLDLLHPSLRCRQPVRAPEPVRSVSGDTIDMVAVVRASQALSSETSLARLRNVVAELLLAMTGATAVSLVVREKGRGWFLIPELLSEAGGAPVPLDEAVGLGLVPVSLFNVAQRTGEPLVVDDATRDDRFSHDRYLADYACCSMLALPILNHGAPRAVLLLENRLSRGAFTPDLLDAVALISGQLAVSLENALLYESLEERVRERTRELQEAQSELVAAARHAGMAEIASNVLHNVGNVLNSVNVSAALIAQRLRGSRLSGLSRAVRLMKEHTVDLEGYLGRDEKGKLLPLYLEKLDDALAAERTDILDELSRLSRSVDHIKEIVSTQQRYAGCGSLADPVQVYDLVEDSLRMNQGLLARLDVTVVREFRPVPRLPLDKARVLQILVNLMSNAGQAMASVEPSLRLMTLLVEMAGSGRLRIAVSDRGRGIAAEHLSLIFSHGFTTRKGGHGFGLHSCALAARDMGGTLSATSAGAGEGATFILEIPVQDWEAEADAHEAGTPSPSGRGSG